MVNLLWKKKEVPTLCFPVFQRTEKLGRYTGNYMFLPSPSFPQKATTLYLGVGDAHMNAIFDIQLLTSYGQPVRPMFPHYIEFSALQSSTRV